MAADAKANSDAERFAVIETHTETAQIADDIKVMLDEMRSDIKNLKWQLGVIVAVLSTVISFLMSRIPV